MWPGESIRSRLRSSDYRVLGGRTSPSPKGTCARITQARDLRDAAHGDEPDETTSRRSGTPSGTRKDVTGVSSRFARFRVEFTSTGMQALHGARCALECGEGVNPS